MKELTLQLAENINGRDLIIGDLHGCYDRLMRLLDVFNLDATVDRVISVGDLIDRGPDGKKCLLLLDEDWFYGVRGNHEAMMLDTLRNNRVDSGIQWLKNGGHWFFDEFSALEKQNVEEAIHLKETLLRLTDPLPCLITLLVSGRRCHVVHAMLPKGATDRDVEGQFQDFSRTYYYSYSRLMETLLWGRSIWLDGKTAIRPLGIDEKGMIPILDNQYARTKLSTVFCGHTSRETPAIADGHVCLDTGSGQEYYYAQKSTPFPSKLTGYCLQEDRFYSVE